MTDYPDGTTYRMHTIDNIDLVQLINLINRITLIDTISTITDITNIASVDLIDLITTISEITKIVNIETIGSMPDTTPRGNEGVAFIQEAAGAGAWTTPTGHEDGVGWTSPTYAYDDNETSYAMTAAVNYPSWSTYLTLTVAALTSNKLRFKANTRDYEGEVFDIDVDVYKDGGWVDVYQGTVPSSTTWYEKTFNQGSVTKIRVRFYCKRVDVANYKAWLREVDFWTVPTTGGQMHVHLYGWDGSAWQKLRCDSDGFILTKAG